MPVCQVWITKEKVTRQVKAPCGASEGKRKIERKVDISPKGPWCMRTRGRGGIKLEHVSLITFHEETRHERERQRMEVMMIIKLCSSSSSILLPFAFLCNQSTDAWRVPPAAKGDRCWVDRDRGEREIKGKSTKQQREEMFATSRIEIEWCPIRFKRKDIR
jgi:hypothetical protein